MERYTVNILYRNRENPAKLVGLVEENGIAAKRGFVGMEGLWRILTSPNPRAAPENAGSSERRENRPHMAPVELFEILRGE